MSIPVDQSALILIDIWDLKDERLKKEQIYENIIKTKVAPLLIAARAANMLILHAVHRPIGWDGINPQLDVLPRKRDKEFIESSLGKVQEILRKNKILHLFYIGGATNMCIVQRPVGIRKMPAIRELPGKINYFPPFHSLASRSD